MFQKKSDFDGMLSVRFWASAACAALLFWASPASAQTLGAAQSYAVLGGTSVTVAGGGATVTGDVGVSPGTSITGPLTVVPPYGVHNNDGSAIAAQASVTALYTTLATMGGATPLGAELGGLTLGPGTYSFASTAHIAAGTTLTLTGGGNYIFQVGSAVTAEVTSNMVLAGGASACNVYWQVTSAATLNGVNFYGTVVAQAAVTLGVGAALNGRALTTALGAVTLSGGNTVGGCSTPGAACPVITLSPNPLPNGTVGLAYSQLITASGGTGTYTFTVSSGTLSGTLTLSPGGLLSGTPAAPGSVTIRATDGNGCFAEIQFTVVPAGCPTITLSPSPLPNGTVGLTYNQLITASPAGTYTFTVSSGTLSGTLTLLPGGLLSGTPATTGTVTIRATDARGCFAEIPFTVVAYVPASIPTLPGWGLMVFSALLMVVSIYFVRRASGV